MAIKNTNIIKFAKDGTFDYNYGPNYSNHYTKAYVVGNIDSPTLSGITQFSHSWSVAVHSPVDIAVVNQNGQTAGVIDGQFSQDFPITYDSDGENKIITIDQNIGSNYAVILKGTGTGTFTMESLASIGGQDSQFVTTGSVVPGEKLTYDVSISPDHSVTVHPHSTTVPTCIPPPSGDWTISSSCTLTSTTAAPANVIVQSGKVLTIPNGLKLHIDLTHYHLLVKSGGGVLVKTGGAIK